jgi:hypothetical protein
MLSDEQKILNLCYTYAELVDARENESVGRMFEHGEVRSYADQLAADNLSPEDIKKFTGGGQPIVGAVNVQEFYDWFRVLPPTRHVITNVIVNIDETGELANARSYFHSVQLGPGLPIVNSGRYQDRFRKTCGEWRFEQKIIRSDYVNRIMKRSKTG